MMFFQCNLFRLLPIPLPLIINRSTTKKQASSFSCCWYDYKTNNIKKDHEARFRVIGILKTYYPTKVVVSVSILREYIASSTERISRHKNNNNNCNKKKGKRF
jgi:hypothetical protein